METTKYDQAIVTSYFAEAMGLISSEIVPGSTVELFKVPENVVQTAFTSPNGFTYENQYFEYPLYPMVGDVSDFSRGYIYIDYNVAHGIVVPTNTYSDIYLAVGPKYASATASVVQFGINGASTYDDQFNFINATIQSAAACASEAEHSPEYTTIDGLLRNKISPMRIICIPKTSGLDYTAKEKAYKLYTYNTNYSYSIDLNRICITLSNFQFTTKDDGALMLRYWFSEMLNNFHYMVLPATNSLQLAASAATGILGVQSANGIITINPVRWSPATNGDLPNALTGGKYAVDFGEYTEWIPIPAPISYKASDTALELAVKVPNGADFADIVDTVKSDNNVETKGDYSKGFLSIPIMFTFDKPAGVTNVLRFNRTAAYQYTSLMKEPAKERLRAMYAACGNLIIRPTQRLESIAFTDADHGPSTTSAPNTQLQRKITKNNITHFIVSNAPTNQRGNSCLMNFFRNTYTLYLNGSPLNTTPYDKVDGRVIKDYTNAIYDTDTEEINNDYLYSLQFPNYISRAGVNPPGGTEYFVPGDFAAMKTINWNSATKMYFKQPNVFFDVYSTGAPNSFMTGVCIAPRSVGETQVMLSSSYNSLNAMASNTEHRYAPVPMKFTEEGTTKIRVASDYALTLPSYLDRRCTTWLTTLRDVTFTLSYDPTQGRAISSSIDNVYPFKAE